MQWFNPWEYTATIPEKQEMLGILFHTLLLHLHRLNPERFHQTAVNLSMEEARRDIEEHFSQAISVQELADRYHLPPRILSFGSKNIPDTPHKNTAICVA